MTRLRDTDSPVLESRMGFPRPTIWVRDMGQDGTKSDLRKTVTFTYASWIILGPLNRNIQASKRCFTAANRLGIYARVPDLAELNE